VALLDNAKLGKIVVDAKGRTLYLFEKDSGMTSNCSDACAKAWPPAVVTAKPTAGPGIDATKLATTKRSDGSTQLTYGGHPLYQFAGDGAAGDANGQDSNGVWYVVGADGNKVDKG
jgi:predicted lipoprotein with Yx(FWY)xxD motif